jgi:hypothetical protein
MASPPKKGVMLPNGMRYNHGQIIGPTLPTRSMSGKPIHPHKYKHAKPTAYKLSELPASEWQLRLVADQPIQTHDGKRNRKND